MNVLEVVEACSAGVGRHVIGLCEGLASQGHRVTVAYAPRRRDEAFKRFMREQRDRIHFSPLEVSRKVSPASDLRGLLQLLSLIRREGPFDIVHGHSSKGGALGRLAGRLSGVPTVYTPHSLIMSSPEISKTSSTFYTQIERTLGRFATSRFIAVSEDEREFFLRLKLASEQRVAVVENAIDDRDFEYLSEEAAHEDMREKPLTFGSTMRFSAQKAPHHLIEAFLRTTHDLPKVPMRLVIAGDGELYGEAKKQVEGSGAGEKISIPGWSDDVKELLQNLDVFVVSSAYESGLSYSTMEAMAAELPIVSTNVFGTRNTISKLPGNILVPVGDPAALAKGMKQMAALATPETLRHELREIGRTNRAYVQEHFRQTEITRRTIEIYRSLQRQ